ncbi:MAG: 2-oxoglutarate dehydrogenase E1 component, partial [Pseudomonadales bacterium]|nr:2-oxoglutarate dehydrogenase E1 component [Pseudomonadales bacterium]
MHDTNMKRMWQSAHMQGSNLAYVEELYEAYLLNAQAVSQEWRDYFDALPKTNGSAQPEPSYATIEKQFLAIGKQTRAAGSAITDSVSIEHEKKQVRVLSMIHAYRFRGHQRANLDPLGLMRREEVPDLNLAFHDLSSDDHHTGFRLGSLFFGPNVAPLHEIVRDLEKTYCGSIGFEYMHAVDTRVKRWFQQRIEPVRGQPEYSHEVKKDILFSLTAAEGLEKYLGARYP